MDTNKGIADSLNVDLTVCTKPHHQELLDLVKDIVDWDSTTWAMPRMEAVARKLLMDAARNALEGDDGTT